MSGAATSGGLKQRPLNAAPRRRFDFKHASVSLLWFGVVPAALAGAAAYLLASSAPPADGSPFEAWLQDQVVLVSLVAFVASASILRYWKTSLPPKHFWNEATATSGASDWRSLVSSAGWVIAAAAAALGLRAFVAEPAKVRSISMLPTLSPSDLLLVSKWSRRTASVRGTSLPERGRVILLDTPDPAIGELEPALFKRVVGLPGDVLSVEQGAPVINGWRVPRCPVGLVSFDLAALDASTGGGLAVEWLGDETYLTLMDGTPSPEPRKSYTVRAGEVWVLGDNRNRSSDSRNWFGGEGGGVPLESVKGYPTWSLLNTLGGVKLRVARVRVPELPPKGEHLSAELAACLAKKPDRTTPPSPK
ncbi:MAG: signal peptidase I [Myxococcales bacterium]|nr:MAG: signal peptidase I [Myxococcales bacterium]